ncbi:TonB-dependent receptor [Caulobacter rhizosphaerae]|uniref:TonB-dependent receptor n=1 Tax=Caulobacter rhizosphaerae TaxID=2010972 RepID=A0ABU1N5C9_9CAUL|nr:TonB-dependent receptor [Caulobacter rhizosphaerae]MDR6533280.1 TonB-dependent receptor [Caulobacter rhizosphaerae]
MSSRNTRRNAMLMGASALVICGALPAIAAAQTAAAPAQGVDTVEEVVVTGIRASLKSAQEIKRNSEQIVDSITAQDIGALPDRSVSEALQRIPGVTLQRTNENRDPARLASEGGGVFIRGLSWVRSETNGRDIFSANNGRALSFEDVSADLLAGVDVYKNPSAELIEGGIGGIVNLRTRKPFDSNKRLLAFSADYNYADLRDKGFASGNVLYSDRWNTNIGEIGLLLSGSIGNIGNRTDSIQTGRFEERTLTANDNPAAVGKSVGDKVYIPNSIGWRRIDWQQKRTAFAGALQWRPNDQWEATFQMLTAKADPHDIERALGDTDGGYAATGPGFKYDSQGSITNGTINNFHLTADTRYGEQHKKTEDYGFNLKFTPNDRWAFSADAQYVKSHASVLSMTAFTQMDPTVPSSLTFDISGDDPVLKLNQATDTTRTQAAYWWAAAMDHIEDNSADSKALRADAEYTFEDDSWLKSFRFGVRGTDKTSLTRQTGWNWGLLSNQFWLNNANTVYLNGTGYDATHQSPNLPLQSELVNYNDFFRGKVQLPGVGWFPAEGLVSNGAAHAYGYLQNTQSAGWGWAPLTEASYANSSPAGDNPNGGTNSQGEKTKAIYALLRFGHDETPLGRMDGNVGVRVVKTEVNGGDQIIKVASLQGTPGACAAVTPAISCTAFNNAYAFTQGGSIAGGSSSNSYTDVLPSANLRFFLKDDLQFRLAAAKAIVRPTFSQMQSYTNLSFNFEADGFTPKAIDPRSGSGGNPLLKPTKSNQFDASLEWYFNPAGSLTFATFYKDISNYIFMGNATESYTSGGQTYSFLVSRNMNGSSGTIKGFELAYTQFYDFLPGPLSGLGLQANFTYVDSNGGKNTAVNLNESAQVAGAADQTLPLEGLSKTSYNVTLLYEKYGVSARLAYNWRERYLLTTSAANIQRPVWSEDYGQLDGSVLYSLTPQYKIGIQATNILNARTYLDVGGANLAPRYSWTDTDRRVAVLLRASF